MPSITCLPNTSPNAWMMIEDEKVSLSRSICCDFVIAIHHEDGLALFVRHPGDLDRLDGLLASQPVQLGVRVSHIARHEVVELPEVLEVIEQLHEMLLYPTG